MIIVIYNNGSVEKFKKARLDYAYNHGDFVFDNSSPSLSAIDIFSKNRGGKKHFITRIQHIWIKYNQNTYYFRIAAPAKVEITSQINQKVHISCQYFCLDKNDILLSKLDYFKHLNKLIQNNALDAESLTLAMLSPKFMAFTQFGRF